MRAELELNHVVAVESVQPSPRPDRERLPGERDERWNTTLREQPWERVRDEHMRVEGDAVAVPQVHTVHVDVDQGAKLTALVEDEIHDGKGA